MKGWSVTEAHCSWGRFLEAFYQDLVPILLLVTDKLLFLNQQKTDKFSMKECVPCGG